MADVKQWTIKEIANYVVEKYPKSCFAEEALRDHIDLNDEEWMTDMLADFFAYDILQLCGCGIPEDTWEVIRRLLTIRSKARDLEYEQIVQMYKDELHLDNDDELQYGSLQFILYILNDKGFLEHGSSVGGSWLTDLGKMYLTILDARRASTPDGDATCQG